MDIRTAMKNLVQNKFKKEGEDHILVSPFAETLAGRVSALNYRLKFETEEFGTFVSPINFVAWLQTGEEANRYSKNVKYKPGRTRQEKEFWTKVLYWAKYQQLKAVKKLQEIDPGVLDMPWAEYRTLPSGLKEFFPNAQRAQDLKKIFEAALKNEPFPIFDEEDFMEELKAYIIEAFNLQELVEQEEQGQQESKEQTEEQQP